MTHKLSYSQIDTYLRCPRRYYYHYVEKIKPPLSKALSFGISLHNALHQFLLPQLGGDTLFDEEPNASLEELYHQLDKAWLSYGYDSPEHERQRREDAKTILTTWHEHFTNEETHVAALEKPFSLLLGEITITGRIDRIDTKDGDTLLIIDYKTGKVHHPKKTQDKLQLGLYKLALQHTHPKKNILLALDFISHDLRVPVTLDPNELQLVENTVQDVAKSIVMQQFNATPGQVCAHCPYAKICPDYVAETTMDSK